MTDCKYSPISKENVDKFKQIYREENNGKEISEELARTELTALITFMDAVYKHQNGIDYE